jgi:hypothetical protein
MLAAPAKNLMYDVSRHSGKSATHCTEEDFREFAIFLAILRALRAI